MYQSGSSIAALVGIGTTNPTSNLQVYGTPIAAGNVFSVLNTAASGNVAQFSSSSGTALIINASGNVGIGTTNPTSNLQVVGNVLSGNVISSVAMYGVLAGANTVAASTVTATSLIGTHYGTIVGSNTVSSSNILVASGLPASIIQGSNVFVFSNAYGFANVMVMNSTGSIGIGTTNPSAKFHVEQGQMFIGNSAYPWGGSGTSAPSGYNIRFDNTYNGIAGAGTICNKISLYNDTTFQAGFSVELNALVYHSGANHTWYTGTTGSAYGTQRMILLNNGNLGIGTASPSSQLHVTGNTLVNAVGYGAASLSIDYDASDYYGSIIGKGVHWDGTNYNIYSDAANRGCSAIQLQWRNIVFYTRADGGQTTTLQQNAAAFSANERMRITAGGNVGIGTASPQAVLDVRNSALIGDYAVSGLYNSNAALHIRRSGVNPHLIIENIGVSTGAIAGVTGGMVYGTDQGGFHAFRTGCAGTGDYPSTGTERMRINTTGVGIGTASPYSALNVWGSGPFSGLTANPQPGQLIVNTTNGTERLILGVWYTGGTGSICSIQSSDYYSSADHGQSLVLNPLGGYVGIGTSPSAFFHVSAAVPSGVGGFPSGTNVAIDNTGNNYLTFRNSSDNGTYCGIVFMDNNIGGWIVFKNYTGSATQYGDALHIGGYNGVFIYGGTSSSVDPTARTCLISACYNSNGSSGPSSTVAVGIGTTNPSYTLDVNGTGRFNTADTLTIPSISTTYSLNTTSINVAGRVWTNDSSSSVGSRPAQGFYVWSDYNFGMELQNQNGTWNTSFITRASDGGFNFKKSDGTQLVYINNSGTMTATADVVAYSDERLKTNLKIIDNALDKVSNINGYTFTRTNEADKDKRHVGVIAQEIQKVLPELVHEDDKGMLSVAYGNITALLIEALKEERAKREALEKRFEEYILSRP